MMRTRDNHAHKASRLSKVKEELYGHSSHTHTRTHTHIVVVCSAPLLLHSFVPCLLCALSALAFLILFFFEYCAFHSKKIK